MTVMEIPQGSRGKTAMPFACTTLPPLQTNRSHRISATTSIAQQDEIFHEVIGDKVYVAQNLVSTLRKPFRSFSTHRVLQYHPLCDDFGPVNMACVIRFIQMVDEELAFDAAAPLVYCVEDGKRELTNAIFLLGAYMIIKQNATVTDVLKATSWLDESYLEPFRDATYGTPDFGLTLADCWRALKRGRNLGWIRTPQNTDDAWGMIDIEEYCHYDEPLNGDLHIVVPGKFIAFKGPRDLGSREYMDESTGFRHFAPTYYVDIFHALGVTAVVRLNEPEYTPQAFTSQGLQHHELEFEDCTAPPHEIVASFFHAVERQPDGALLAVHCKAGIGRTGTLIALYMMRTYGFAAREAIAWLRIMRPGCVIGEQQRYLCKVEETVRERVHGFAAAADAASAARPASPAPPARASPSLDASASASSVGEAGGRLGTLRALLRRSNSISGPAERRHGMLAALGRSSRELGGSSGESSSRGLGGRSGSIRESGEGSGEVGLSRSGSSRELAAQVEAGMLRRNARRSSSFQLQGRSSFF